MILDEIAPFKICVNLAHRKDRRTESWSQFAKLGMEVVRFPAIDVHRVKSTWGYKNASRYACSLSKRLAIRTGKLAGASAVLLLEDDVVFTDDLHERLAKIELPDDWGILFLGCKHIDRPVIVSAGLVRVSQAADHHAMIIRSTYANEVLCGLAGTRKNAKHTIAYSDVKMSWIQAEIPTYACFPNLAWQRPSHSDNAGFITKSYDKAGRQVTENNKICVNGLIEEMQSTYPEDEITLPSAIAMDDNINLNCPSGNLIVSAMQRVQLPKKQALAPSILAIPSWRFLYDLPIIRNFQDAFPMAYYINLGRREDRRCELEFQFRIQCLEVQRFAAVDARFVRNWHEFRTKSQYACSLSHRMAIRQAKLKRASCVLIFEDDVVLHPFFRDIMERLPLPADWGILLLGCTHVEPPEVVKSGWVRVKKFWGLQAYVVKREWYEMILGEMRTRERTGDDMAADVVLSNLVDQIPTYSVYPNIAWQADGYSDLMNTTRSPFTIDGQQNRLLHAIKEVNESMRHKIACEYCDDVVDEKKHTFLQPKDVFLTNAALWSMEKIFPLRLCLNLEQRTDRRMQATEQFAKIAMEVEFFSAVDGRKKSQLTDPGAYGCALSHILMLRKAWQSGAEAVLIFEDDVVIHKNLRLWVEAIELPVDWGMCYFGNQHMYPPSIEQRGLVRIHESQSTHAYAVRREWIPTVMKAMREGLKTCRPCDLVLVELHQMVPTYGFYPNLAWQRQSYSNITGRTVRPFETDGVQRWQQDTIKELDADMRWLCQTIQGA